MVRREPSDNVLTSRLVRKLLLNKFVVILGDSIQRGIYKDLVSLLQRDIMLNEGQLKTKGEMMFMGDNLIEGGNKGQMHNGVNYTEVRQYQTTTHLVRFYFVTRCYSPYVESIMRDLEEGPKPDLVIMNSCLWDITRYGQSSITEYKKNMAMLFNRFAKVLPPDCLMVWNTTMPISKNAHGGFLVQEIEVNKQTLRMDILEANFFARQIVVSHGFDILDLHFWFRGRLEWRVGDGIHWCAEAHRCMSELLLSHVASAWGIPFPPINFSTFQRRPLMQQPESEIPWSVKAAAARLTGEPSHRSNGRKGSNAAPYRSAPYPVFPLPRPGRRSRPYQSYVRSPLSSNHYDEPLRSYSSYPQSDSRSPPTPLLSIPDSFRSGWSAYTDDNFRGAQRRQDRRARSRNLYY